MLISQPRQMSVISGPVQTLGFITFSCLSLL
jgi:hypothetical protein